MERKILAYGSLALLIFAMLATCAHATWKPEFAQLSQETRDWYKSQEMMPAAQERLKTAWKSCCEHGDVVKTKFRVEEKKPYRDEWWYLDNEGNWKQVPPDVIHWEEHAPDGQPTLFMYISNRWELCFYPPTDGN